MNTIIDRQNLSCDHEIALTNLVELVRDLHLFEEDEKDDTMLYTTGEVLNLEHFSKNDWLLCLDAIGEKKNPFEKENEE